VAAVMVCAVLSIMPVPPLFRLAQSVVGTAPRRDQTNH
jgi:hypothetical protein